MNLAKYYEDVYECLLDRFGDLNNTVLAIDFNGQVLQVL